MQDRRIDTEEKKHSLQENAQLFPRKDAATVVDMGTLPEVPVTHPLY